MTDVTFYTNSFQTNLNIFIKLFDIQDDLVKWKQSEDKWNLLEIACHLYDEEKEDFRARLKLLLESPGTPFLTIDPTSWVVSRNYNNQDLQSVLAGFSIERKQSIVWLQSLKNPNWENTFHHPKVGPITAKFMLANWLAHDYLHIRQITKLKYDYLRHSSGMGLDYAGNW